ncbi:MAG: ATP-binding protein [Candidatus Thermoplasmatota archaeon]
MGTGRRGRPSDQPACNLLANAVTFTPAGKAVHVRSVRASGGVAVFIQDEGIGIS